MADTIPSSSGKPGVWIKVIIAVLVTAGVLSILWMGGCFQHTPTLNLRLWSVSFSPDGRSVVAGGGENPALPPPLGELTFWQIGSDSERSVRQNASVRSVAWSPDGKYIAVADLGGVAKLVSPKNGQTLLSFSPPASLMNAIAVGTGGRLVAGATFDGTVDLWDRGGKEQNVFVVQGEKFLDVAISPSDLFMVATAKSGKAFLFDLEHPGDPVSLQAYAGPPRFEPTAECAAFSPDNLALATGSLTRLRIWDTRARTIQQDIRCTANVNNVAFAPDGDTVATVHADGALALWNYRTGAKLNSTQAHPSEAFGLSFSPDGKRIATASRQDYTIKIWNAETLQLEASHHRFKSP